MIEPVFIDQKTAESQIDRVTIIREYVQILFLRYFYEKKGPDKKVFFKGGTAIRLLFNSFRFSEDLDFTCLEQASQVEQILKKILPQLETESGFKILIKDRREFRGVGLGIRLVLQPNELIRQPLGIRLDFSFREEPLEPEVSAISTDYPVSPFPLVSHLSKREILAEKIRAILTRGRPRDLFDTWFLLKQKTEINWDFVTEKMKYYPKIKFSLKKLTGKICKFKPEELKKDLNQFLPVNYRQYYPKILKELVAMIEAVDRR